MLRPLHDDGQECAGGRSRRGKGQRQLFPEPELFNPAFGDLVTREQCRCGGEGLLAVQHRDGRLLFERVDWPWERHICNHGLNVDYGIDFMARRMAALNIPVNLAIVAGVKRFWAGGPVHLVALSEVTSSGSRHCVRLRRKETASLALQQREVIVPGEFVAIQRTTRIEAVFTTNDVEMACVEHDCSPEDLGIPGEWNGSWLIKI